MTLVNPGVRLVVTAFLAVLTLRASRAIEDCFPVNETVACFARIPNEVLQIPVVQEDSYVSNQEQVVDVNEFNLAQVQRDPRDFCQYKSEILTALDCINKAMADRCPQLPPEIMSKHDRLGEAMDNFCSQLDSINTQCMAEHLKTTFSCHEEMMQQKGMMTTPGWAEPESQARDTTPMDSEVWNSIICRMKYRMMDCVQRNIVGCDQKTADVMSQFIKDMSSEHCAHLMMQWAGGATSFSVAWATALSSICSVLLALLRRMQFE